MIVEFKPRFDKRIAGWSATYAKKHVWKFGGQLDVDDLMQEAWVVFQRCRERAIFENSKHFMGYFKTAFSRKIIDLTRTNTRKALLGAGVNLPNPELLESTDHALEAAKLISRMPDEIRLIVQAVLSNPNGKMLRDETGRESTNEYLSRISGVGFADHRTQLVTKIISMDLD